MDGKKLNGPDYYLVAEIDTLPHVGVVVHFVLVQMNYTVNLQIKKRGWG